MKIEITPVIVVPDMSPLIHFAAGGILSLLNEFGRVVVMDIVAYEANDDLSRPWAREVAAWLALKWVARHWLSMKTRECRGLFNGSSFRKWSLWPRAAPCWFLPKSAGL